MALTGHDKVYYFRVLIYVQNWRLKMRKDFDNKKGNKPMYHQLRYRILGLDYTVDLGEIT